MFSFIKYSLPKSEDERNGRLIQIYFDKILALLENERTSEQLSVSILEFFFDQFIVHLDEMDKQILDVERLNNIIVHISREVWREGRLVFDKLTKLRQT